MWRDGTCRTCRPKRYVRSEGSGGRKDLSQQDTAQAGRWCLQSLASHEISLLSHASRAKCQPVKILPCRQHHSSTSARLLSDECAAGKDSMRGTTRLRLRSRRYVTVSTRDYRRAGRTGITSRRNSGIRFVASGDTTVARIIRGPAHWHACIAWSALPPPVETAGRRARDNNHGQNQAKPLHDFYSLQGAPFITWRWQVGKELYLAVANLQLVTLRKISIPLSLDRTVAN